MAEPPKEYHFPGFAEEAFAILDRLKANPHIDQYRTEKEGIRQYLTKPFKAYRDDLVVHWVLPAQLSFETERNVFSRLLKNDFGAGGCHHHLWLSFYRPGYRRLTDVQLGHSLSPHGMNLSLFVGAYGKRVLKAAKARSLEQESTFLALLGPLLQDHVLRLEFLEKGKKTPKTYLEAISHLPPQWEAATDIWIGRQFPREHIITTGPHFMDDVLKGIDALWPLYQFWAEPLT